MFLKNFNVKNKTALVTGSGKGIGKACAIALAEAGANVIILSRTEKDLLIVQNKIKKLKKKCSCLLYTSPSPRDLSTSRMPSSA